MAVLKSGSSMGGFPLVNTLELNRRIDAVNSAISLKANTASPTFTGTPRAVTHATASDSSTQIATNAFVQNAISNRIKFFTNSTTVTTSNLPTNAVGFTY